MKITRWKWLRFLLPQACPSRRELRVAVRKSVRSSERLKRDLEQRSEALRAFTGRAA